MQRRTFLRGGASSLAAVATAGAAVRAAQGRSPNPEEKHYARTGSGAAEVVWSFRTERRAVALTFDDGPHPLLTPMVADLLAERGLRATFFLIGSVAEQHPALVQRLMDDGHELANHTWSHQSMAHATGREARDEVLRGSAAVERLAGVRPQWFRSPRGMLNGAVLRAAADCDQHVAMWSAMPSASLLGTPRTAVDRLVDALEPGAIYLFHDGTSGREDDDLLERRHRELPVLAGLLDRAIAQGYDLLTLTELSAARSVLV